jgi:hypothetical protein
LKKDSSSRTSELYPFPEASLSFQIVQVFSREIVTQLVLQRINTSMQVVKMVKDS